MWTELSYTLKLIKKNFGFSLLCMLILGCGIGLVLTVYAFVYNSAYTTPSITNGERFVAFVKQTKPRAPGGLSNYDAFHVHYFQDNSSSFATVATWKRKSAVISDGAATEAWRIAALEPVLLQSTGVQPLLGRLFSNDDVQTNASPVAIIGYDLWQSYYAGRQDIIGHNSRIDGENKTIVGVLPEGFGFPTADQLWTPLATPEPSAAGIGKEELVITGILKPGVSVKQARAEIELLEQNIKQSWPEHYKHFDTSVVLPFIQLTGENNQTPNLTVLLIILALVAINIGNLFLARAEERMQELAIRSALGAQPLDLGQTLLLESAVLCVGGVLLGMLLAYFGIDYFNAMIATSDPQLTATFWWDMSLNRTMLQTTAVVVVGIWLLSGGIPAWRLSRTSLEQSLSITGKGAGAPKNTRMSKILVNAQLVLACALISVGLVQNFLLSLAQTTELPNASTTYSGALILPATHLATNESKTSYLQTLEQVLLQQPGVTQASFATLLPVTTGAQRAYAVEDQDLKVEDRYPTAFSNAVSNGYFEFVNLPIIEGRGFTPQDNAESLPVAVIDQRLAQKLWPNAVAVGKRIQLEPDKNSRWLTIVGISAPSIQEFIRAPGQSGDPVIFQTLQQAPSEQVNVLISSAVANFDYQKALRTAAQQADRDTPITDAKSFMLLQKTRKESIQSNINMLFVTIVLAALISGAATYGLAARASGRRRVEIGIRMALGASTASSMMIFMKDGFKTVSIGLGLGIPLSITGLYFLINAQAATQASLWVLFPLTFFICLLMGAIVMLANYFPAKKIVNMEPADALRYE